MCCFTPGFSRKRLAHLETALATKESESAWAGRGELRPSDRPCATGDVSRPAVRKRSDEPWSQLANHSVGRTKRRPIRDSSMKGPSCRDSDDSDLEISCTR